jgi:hypothetical protein
MRIWEGRGGGGLLRRVALWDPKRSGMKDAREMGLDEGQHRNADMDSNLRDAYDFSLSGPSVESARHVGQRDSGDPPDYVQLPEDIHAL